MWCSRSFVETIQKARCDHIRKYTISISTVQNRFGQWVKDTLSETMAGKSKSGCGFKSRFSCFPKSGGFGFGLDLYILDLSFSMMNSIHKLFYLDLDLNITGFAHHCSERKQLTPLYIENTEPVTSFPLGKTTTSNLISPLLHTWPE